MSAQTGRRRLSAEEGQRLRINLTRVAGLAAVLGLLMEGILVIGGEASATLGALLDHGLWPYMVCMAGGDRADGDGGLTGPCRGVRCSRHPDSLPSG